uniref:ZZ-type domain-containing protein n=1 Tax=Capitella teleta TaxID=283909 RepID=X2A592_CAPTE
MKVYADQSCLTVKYLDEDNDEILIQSQAEMLEAFRVAKKSSNTLHLKVYCASPRASASSSPAPTETAAALSDEDQVVELKIEVEKKEEEKPCPPPDVRLKIDIAVGDFGFLRMPCSYMDSPNQSGNYGRLLEEIRKATENGLNASEASEEANEMHFIFKETFEKFKSDLAEEISRKTAQKTVDGVLQGLESAVITSVSSGNTPQSQHAGKIPKNVSKPATYCHFGVICDICENTIIGPRYKCGNCADFDLCEECERHAEMHHNPSHVFLKIRRPVALAGHEGQQKAPLLPFNVFDGSLPSPPQSSDAPMVDNWSQVDGRLQKLSNREMMKMVKLEERRLRCEAKMKRKEEKMRREKSKEQSREVPKTEITRHSH